MNRVAVVDYGLCNLDSVRRAVQECGGLPLVTADPAALAGVDRIILPGVGSFPQAMSNLRTAGLVDALTHHVMDLGMPFLGICLGMQLIATHGEEGEPCDGLGWIDATVTALEPRHGDRVPHIGWNEVTPAIDNHLFDGVEPGTDFYFVHGFHVVCDHDKHTAATTPHCGRFASAIADDVVFGVQFHPEKSQASGFRVLRNFLQV